MGAALRTTPSCHSIEVSRQRALFPCDTFLKQTSRVQVFSPAQIIEQHSSGAFDAVSGAHEHQDITYPASGTELFTDRAYSLDNKKPTPLCERASCDHHVLDLEIGSSLRVTAMARRWRPHDARISINLHAVGSTMAIWHRTLQGVD